MLIAAAVSPHPPLLIPAALGGGAAHPPAALRGVLDACDDAVSGLVAAGPDLVAVVGGGPQTREFGPESAGSLHEFGVEATVGTGEPVLPLSLTVGRWLLERAGVLGAGGAFAGERERGRPGTPPPVLLQEVDERAPATACLKLGMVIAERSPRVALLAMGDASARRARDTPGAPDPEAQEYDDEVAEALAAADTRWLARLDPSFDGKLLVAGRAAWQVLAGAASAGRFHGRLRSMSAPYGVTYLVASWEELPAG